MICISFQIHNLLMYHSVIMDKSKASVIMLPQKVGIILQKGYAKQKHPAALPMCNHISAEAKKSPIKDAFKLLE